VHQYIVEGIAMMQGCAENFHFNGAEMMMILGLTKKSIGVLTLEWLHKPRVTGLVFVN